MLSIARSASSSNRQSLLSLGAIGLNQLRLYGTDKHATTVICVRKDGEVVMMADGQITAGSMIVKPNARKVRKLGEAVIGGFAGATADGLTLFERLEMKLEEHPGQLRRAAVELAKAWRQDKVLRRLEANLIVADANVSLQISGDGDVLEPFDDIIAIGSGSPFALAAARALMPIPGLTAAEIAERSMKIAADCCVYTNNNFICEKLKLEESSDESATAAAAAAAADPTKLSS